MNLSTSSVPWRIAVLVIFVLVDGCVDRIEFEVPTAQSQIFVDGLISDASGPYTVKISQGLDLNADTIIRAPIRNLKVTLYDDLGNTEPMTENAPGDYSSSGVIRGKVGRSYHITIETPDGKIFESTPDLLNPVGEIQKISYEFEHRQKEENFGLFDADVFNILVDAQALEGDENYVRWRFKGTYKVVTTPEFRWIWLSGFALWTPFQCSGVTVIPLSQYDPLPSPLTYYAGPLPLPSPGLQGKLSRIADCTCCTCYVNQFESIPQLSDAQLISDNQFRNITVGQVPINSETFFDRYQVEIEQMSLSRKAFEFFKLVRAQKEGASTLFQPPSGEIRGNIRAVNNSQPIIGLFWATSVKSRSLFINKSAVPYVLGPIKHVPFPCDTYYSHSTTTKPALWE